MATTPSQPSRRTTASLPDPTAAAVDEGTHVRLRSTPGSDQSRPEHDDGSSAPTPVAEVTEEGAAPTTTQAPEAPAAEAAPQRERNGRFGQGRSFHAEMDAIAAVALHAALDGEDPNRVSQKRFDQARNELGFAIPSARGICKRQRKRLSEIITLALRPDEGRTTRSDRQNAAVPDFPRDLMVTALKCVARENDGRPPSPEIYDEVVARMSAKRRGKRLTPQRLPHSATVASRFGSWEQALVAAGLVDPADPKQRRRARPAAETLDNFITRHGFLPNSGYFEQWCKQSGIPLGRDLRPWGETVRRCRAARRARGESTPRKQRPTAEAPPIADVLIVGTGGRRKRTYTADDCAASLRAWQESGITGAPTYRGYKAWAQRTDGAVSATTLLSVGGEFTLQCRRLGIG